MRLRETTLADLDLLLKWVPSKQAMVMWSGPTFNWPLTRHQLEAYLKTIGVSIGQGCTQVRKTRLVTPRCSLTKRHAQCDLALFF